MDDMREVIKTPRFILKAVQLIIAIICTALTDGVGAATDPRKLIYVNVIFCGYILLLLMDMSRMVSGGKMAKHVDIFWSFAGGILWITAGALVIEFYRLFVESLPANAPHIAALDRIIAAGIIALLNGLVFFAEAAVTFKSA